MGAEIDVNGATISVRPGATLTPQDVAVPGDVSAAAFWMVAAAMTPDSEIVMPNVGVNPRRTGVIDVLRSMGASIELSNPREMSGEPVADIVVRGSTLHGTLIDGDMIVRALDELPILAVAAAVADGATEIRDAAELRVKESDRIATTSAMLTAMESKSPTGATGCGSSVAVCAAEASTRSAITGWRWRQRSLDVRQIQSRGQQGLHAHRRLISRTRPSGRTSIDCAMSPPSEAAPLVVVISGPSAPARTR